MENCYGANVSQTEPTAPADAPTGYPTDGSSTGGISATVPKAFWYNGVTREITNAIEAGGITPDRADNTQLAQSIAAQDKAVYDSIIPLIEKLQASLAKTEIVPTGMIAFFGSTAAPNSNWLVCDGRAVSRTAYADLFAAVGTTYGEGNGSTTFNLPYLIDRTVWGGSTGIGTAKQAGLPNITGEIHTRHAGEVSATGRGAVVAASGAFGLTVSDGSYSYKSYSTNSSLNATDKTTLDASKSNAIYGRSTTVQPPALVLLPCIHV